LNWDAVGALAELVGAFGVIASLVYLASQIRQNTNAVRGSAHEATVSRNTTWIVAIGSNPQVADLLVRAHRDYRGLSGPERMQFGSLMSAVLLGGEATYLQYRRGNLDEEVWQRSLAIIRSSMASPGMQTWWNSGRGLYTPEFEAIVNEIVSSSDDGPGMPAA
jgi:hypothetical protein